MIQLETALNLRDDNTKKCVIFQMMKRRAAALI